MEDWESEDFEPVAPAFKKEPVRGLWDDEDAEESDVKESWEDEDAPATVIIPAPATEKLPTKKTGGNVTEKKAKEVKADEVAEAAVLADPLAEKLRQQRLVEEADFKATKELFGSKTDEKTLDNFIPKSDSDFSEYATLISNKILPYKKSFHYISLLKGIMRLSMASLKAVDAKEVASSITAIANEKLKVEKEANAGKKKQGAKKKQLHVDKPDDDIIVADSYDALDDYDFM